MVMATWTCRKHERAERCMAWSWAIHYIHGHTSLSCCNFFLISVQVHSQSLLGTTCIARRFMPHPPKLQWWPILGSGAMFRYLGSSWDHSGKTRRKRGDETTAWVRLSNRDIKFANVVKAPRATECIPKKWQKRTFKCPDATRIS